LSTMDEYIAVCIAESHIGFTACYQQCTV
jgi:hypothetical protein